MISSRFSTFSEDLVFPLTFHDFSVDTFDTKSSVNASVEMFFNNRSSDSFSGSYGAIVRTLRSRVVVTFRET